MDPRLVPMDDSVHDQIAGLEQEIEALTESAARCRKIAFAARTAIIIGAVWLAALIFGVIWPNAIALLGSTALILGGIVVSGSNATTARQTEGRIAQAEAQRAALIGEIELRLVPEASRLLH
jgi:Kef-type K+ transport system membrane component KefB